MKLVSKFNPIETPDEVLKVEMDYKPIPPKNIKTLTKQILSQKQNIMDLLNDILPTFNKINTVETDINLKIYITNYGTSASFLYDHSNNITIILRSDAPLSEIVFGILNIFFSKTYGNTQESTTNLYRWQEKQLIIDFFIKHTKLSTIFNKYNSNILNNRVMIPDIMQAKVHSEILDSYKIASNITNFKVKKIVEYDNKYILNLSITEAEILAGLIDRKSQTLTYDDIATLIWRDDVDEKFSLQAINKHIQRIRKILIDNGIHRQVIFSVRNIGYTFID